MKGKINIKKSLIAYLLVIAMVLTMIPVGNQALAAESTTNLGTASINFSSTDGKGNFYFKGCLTSGSFLTNGKYYKGLATIGTNAGTEERNVTLGIGSNGQIIIYSGFFTFANNPPTLVPTASFEIEEGTIFTEVWSNSNSWSEKKEGETPTTFTVARGLRIEKVGETWEQEISNTLSLSYKKGSIVEKTSIYYTGTTNADDGKIASTANIPNHENAARYYKVLATLENENGSYEQEIALSLSSDDGETLDTWYAAGFYKVNDNSNTIFPTKSLTIKKDAVFTEMYHNGSFQEVLGGYRYILGEEFKIVKNDDGSWSEPQAGLDQVTLSYLKGSPNSSGFVFQAGTELAPVGTQEVYYKVEAVFDGVHTKNVVMGLSDSDKKTLTIWYGNNVPGAWYDCNNNQNTIAPTTSFEIKKNTVVTEMYHDGSKFLEIENGNKYCVAERLYIENYNGTWRAPYDEVTLVFEKASNSGEFYFTNTLAQGGNFESGKFYKVKTEVDNADRTVIFHIHETGKAVIWSQFYDEKPDSELSKNVPTTSFIVKKGAEFIEVNSRYIEVDDAKRYQLAEEVSLENVNGWKNKTTVLTQEVINNISYIYVNSSKNFEFNTVINNYSESLNGWYRTKIIVDGVEKDAVLQLTSKGNDGYCKIHISSNCFVCPPDSTTSVVPDKSIVIQQGTILNPINVYANNQFNTIDETRTALFIDKNYRIDATTETLGDGYKWSHILGDANGDGCEDVRDLVRYLRYADNQNVAIYSGADIDDNGSYDDTDSVRKRLVGVTPLVSQSVSNYQIVVPASATSNETVAANELQYFVKEATGATLPVVSETADMEATKGNYLYVGETNAAKEVNVASQTQKKTGFI